MANVLTNSPFGSMEIEPLRMDLSARGITRRSSRWQVLDAFLEVAEGRAVRICEGSSGLILLVAIPGQPSSGAFYVYDDLKGQFYMLSFADQETFHPSMFDYICQFYDLGQFVEQPKLTLVPKPIIAASDSGGGIVQKSTKVKHNNNRRRNNRYRGPRVPQAVIAAATQNRPSLVTV